MRGFVREGAIGVALVSLAAVARAEPPAIDLHVKPPDLGVAANVPWRWEPPGAEADRWHRAFETKVEWPRVAGPAGSAFVFVRRRHQPHARKLDARGAVAWDRPLGEREENAVFVFDVDGDMLYVALFPGATPGCRVVALRASSGARLWETRLHGVGFVAHSAYGNRAQMRLAPEGLVVYGLGFKGRYVEILRPADGSRIGYRFLPW